MNICLFTVAPWIQTGYGRNAAMIASALDQHDVSIAAMYGMRGGPVEYTIPIGGGKKVDVFGLPGEIGAGMEQHLATLSDNFDLIIQHFDCWPLSPTWAIKMKCPVYTYSPVDSTPLPKNIIDRHAGVELAIAMSHFAETAYMRAGIKTHYIPHAIHPALYKVDKYAARVALGLPIDKCIFIAIAANKGPRKNLPNLIKAYADTTPETYMNSVLYIHTYPFLDYYNQHGSDLHTIAQQLGIAENVLFPDADSYLAGIPDAYLSNVYSAADCLVHPSYGEGFGMPIAEAAAYGLPVIATGSSATGEIAGPGWKLPAVNPFHLALTDSFHNGPANNDITKAMDSIMAIAPHSNEAFSTAMVEHAAQYEFSKVRDMWNALIK